MEVFKGGLYSLKMALETDKAVCPPPHASAFPPPPALHEAASSHHTGILPIEPCHTLDTYPLHRPNTCPKKLGAPCGGLWNLGGHRDTQWHTCRLAERARGQPGDAQELGPQFQRCHALFE